MRSLIYSLVIAATLGLAGATEAKVSIMPIPHPPGEWVWVEPVYRTELVRVWIADRVERIPEQYWVSQTYGWRTIICYDQYGQRIESREWGEISPGHWEMRYHEAIVTGHYETQERRVLVSSGYWRRIDPPVYYPPVIVDPPIVRPLNPPTVPVDGNVDRAWDGDKGKFSPLYEWPKQ